MSFEIERGVPLAKNTRGRKATYFPLDQMDVGDSFLIQLDPSDKKAVDAWRRKLANAKKRFFEQHGDGIVFRTAIEAGGLRVGRIA